MNIVCPSLSARYVQIFDDEGKDITGDLMCKRITIVMDAGGLVTARLECYSKVALDLGKVAIKTVSVVPKESSVWLAPWWDVLSGNRRTRRLIQKALDDYEKGGDQT